MRRITKFAIREHGLKNEQYFEGCGTSFTEFQESHTGIGHSMYDALEDALEMAAQNGWDTDCVENTLSKEILVPEDSEDLHVYASILLK